MLVHGDGKKIFFSTKSFYFIRSVFRESPFPSFSSSLELNYGEAEWLEIEKEKKLTVLHLCLLKLEKYKFASLAVVHRLSILFLEPVWDINSWQSLIQFVTM